MPKRLSGRKHPFRMEDNMQTENKKVLISIRDIKQYFPVKKSSFREEQKYVKANDGISLDIYEGETLGLVGESGCGKSTFGRTILQLYPQTHGDIFFEKDGEMINLKEQPAEKLRALRREMQLIFQDPYSSLNPKMTAGQIIGEGLTAHGIYKKGDTALRDYVMDVMKKCGLDTYMFGRYPHQFSGGQRQRIGIARSLALKPRFVVCDEAVSALDVSIQSQILNLLSDLKEQEHLTYLFITHDLSVVKYISDRIGVMYLGNLVELASTEELVDRTLHPYTNALLSAIPTTDVNDKKRDRILLEGDIPSPVNPPTGCKFHTRCYRCQEKCKKEVPVMTDMGNNHMVACHYPLEK